jgi:hypothetical protein
MGFANRNQSDFKLTKGPSSSMLMSDSKFCQDGDFTIRTFGNYMYAIDTLNMNLHVFSIKDKQWNFSKLRELGII